MSSRIYRYEVPVDDAPHEFRLHGNPLAVGCRRYDVVEFWAIHHDDLSDESGQRRRFQVVGTGHDLPHGLRRAGWHIGTAVAGSTGPDTVTTPADSEPVA